MNDRANTRSREAGWQKKRGFPGAFFSAGNQVAPSYFGSLALVHCSGLLPCVICGSNNLTGFLSP